MLLTLQHQLFTLYSHIYISTHLDTIKVRAITSEKNKL